MPLSIDREPLMNYASKRSVDSVWDKSGDSHVDSDFVYHYCLKKMM